MLGAPELVNGIFFARDPQYAIVLLNKILVSYKTSGVTHFFICIQVNLEIA